MNDTVYKKFVKRWEEVTELPPQTLGPLTPWYKFAVCRLKVMPWPALVLVSAVAIVGMYLLIGSGIVLLVTILQRGF